MRPLKFFAFLLLFIACKSKTDKNQLKTLDFGSFKLKTTQDWTIFKEQGIDSYVGGLTNGKDSLWFYYGLYGSDDRPDTTKQHLYCKDTINGYIAILKIPKIDGQGSIRLNISNVNKSGTFYLGGYNINGTESILQIFKSLTFANSDTTKNSILNIAKFKELPIGSGKSLFNRYCAACHSKDMMLIGPALNEELLNTRSKEWILTLLTDRKHLVVDSAYKARRSFFSSTPCLEFEKQQKEDREMIIYYLKGE